MKTVSGKTMNLSVHRSVKMVSSMSLSAAYSRSWCRQGKHKRNSSTVAAKDMPRICWESTKVVGCTRTAAARGEGEPSSITRVRPEPRSSSCQNCGLGPLHPSMLLQPFPRTILLLSASHCSWTFPLTHSQDFFIAQ